MSYLKSLLLYQDKSAYGSLLKIIISIVPGSLLAASICLVLSGENIGGFVLLVEAFIVSIIFWCVFPRMYQVYEDHIRIVLGGPFAVKIRFVKIEAIRVTSRFILSVNFVTKITKNYVEIAKKKRVSIAITPSDSDLFVENAGHALSQWIRMESEYRLLEK